MGELFLLVIAIAAFCSTIAVWYLCANVKQGFSEHIEAMQGVCDEIRMTKRSVKPPDPTPAALPDQN
ncbi:MAG: hypothetical protein ACM3U2_14840 [Deltaproteobacteria bacterium]